MPDGTADGSGIRTTTPADGSVSGITANPGVTNALNTAPADGTGSMPADGTRLGTPISPAQTPTPIATPTPVTIGPQPDDQIAGPSGGPAGTVTGNVDPNINPESGMFGYTGTMPGGLPGNPTLGGPMDPNGAGIPGGDPNANSGMFTQNPGLAGVLNNAIDTGSPTDGTSADGNISTTPGTT